MGRSPALGDAGNPSQPKEESGTSAGEAALTLMLVVPDQLLPVSGPPAVILVAKRTYAEAAATPALERAIHI